MSESRDPAIKLFGRTIPLPEDLAVERPDTSSHLDVEDEKVKDTCGEITETEAKETICEITEKPDHNELDVSSSLHCGDEDDSRAPSQGERPIGDSKTEQEQNEDNDCDQGKALKKLDKVLPCPRCNSLNTKFCYYNNYNINQPRHFCKNCQRYWTAGGAMRNVPVGAGRRKSKHSAPHYRSMSMPSDAIASPQLENPDSVNNQVLAGGLPVAVRPLHNDGSVLNFIPEAPVCEPMASVLNMVDQKKNGEMRPVPCGENGDKPSYASSLTALNGSEKEFPDNAALIEQNGMRGVHNGVAPMHHVQCYPGPPWTCPWSPRWNSVAPIAAGRCSSEVIHGQEKDNTNSVPWNLPPVMAVPALCAPTIQFPLIQPLFWGCMSSWSNGTWNMPWAGTSSSSLYSSASNSVCSGLGKHSRDTSLPGEEKTEKSLWVPKTLRIDDPDEAAKSSIWATLGIKPDPTIGKGGVFKGFQPKSECKDHVSDGNQVLHVNPAALSRSQAFQEST